MAAWMVARMARRVREARRRDSTCIVSVDSKAKPVLHPRGAPDEGAPPPSRACSVERDWRWRWSWRGRRRWKGR